MLTLRNEGSIITTTKCWNGGDNLREWLKVLRVDSGKSQQDVADAIGITKQYYQLIEAGKRQSSLSSLLIMKLANYFNLSPAAILDMENDYIQHYES